jgi:hypothetical protein
VCNGLRGLKWVQTCIAWDCHVWCVVLGLKLMKMCNKKQYICIKLFFPREVRDKNKESSIYTQNSWIVDICLILLYLTKCGYCSKTSLKIPKQVQKDQTNVHNSGILCINWWLFILVSYRSRKK